VTLVINNRGIPRNVRHMHGFGSHQEPLPHPSVPTTWAAE
jgi:hypothetical protein